MPLTWQGHSSALQQGCYDVLLAASDACNHSVETVKYPQEVAEADGACTRAAITNMQSVKRFLARGKVQAPFTDTSDRPHWRSVRLSATPAIEQLHILPAATVSFI